MYSSFTPLSLIYVLQWNCEPSKLDSIPSWWQSYGSSTWWLVLISTFAGGKEQYSRYADRLSISSYSSALSLLSFSSTFEALEFLFGFLRFLISFLSFCQLCAVLLVGRFWRLQSSLPVAVARGSHSVTVTGWP